MMATHLHDLGIIRIGQLCALQYCGTCCFPMEMSFVLSLHLKAGSSQAKKSGAQKTKGNQSS